MSIIPSYNKQKVANSFSRSAPNYDKVSPLQQFTEKHLLDKLNTLQLAPKLILDLGSGTCRSTEQLALKFPNASVIAIDIAIGMLNYAHSILFQKNMHSLCADAESLPLKSNDYDLVFSNLMFQWCRPKAILQEISRILKPKGILLFSTLGPQTLRELRYCWQKVDNHPHIHTFPPFHLLQLELNNALLPILSIEKIYYSHYFLQVIDFMRELKILGANNMHNLRYKGLTTTRKLNKVVEFYEEFRNKHGFLPATYELYLFVAERQLHATTN